MNTPDQRNGGGVPRRDAGNIERLSGLLSSRHPYIRLHSPYNRGKSLNIQQKGSRWQARDGVKRVWPRRGWMEAGMCSVQDCL